METFDSNYLDLVYGGGKCTCFDENKDIVGNPEFFSMGFDEETSEFCLDYCCTQPKVLRWTYTFFGKETEKNCPKEAVEAQSIVDHTTPDS